MSISLATKGRLWMKGEERIVPSQFVNIDVEIVDPYLIEGEVVMVDGVLTAAVEEIIAVEVEESFITGIDGVSVIEVDEIFATIAVCDNND